MAAQGYMPRGDGAFMGWAGTFLEYLQAHTAALGLEAAEAAAIAGAVAGYEAALAAHQTARQQAAAAKEVKNTARAAAESAIRAAVRRIQADPSVNNTQRAALGITVRDTVRTPNIAAITSRPLGRVDTSQRLRHTIAFVDEAAPHRRAKPAGILGCEIWLAVTPAGQPVPADLSELRFLGLATASPFAAAFTGTQAGQTAHYLLRWVKAAGIQGPWSETVSATIVG